MQSWRGGDACPLRGWGGVRVRVAEFLVRFTGTAFRVEGGATNSCQQQGTAAFVVDFPQAPRPLCLRTAGRRSGPTMQVSQITHLKFH